MIKLPVRNILLAFVVLALVADAAKVEVYTVDKCKYCQEVKTYLKEHFIEYQEIQLEGDKWGEMQRRAMEFKDTVKKFGKPKKILILAPQIFIDDVYFGTHRKPKHLANLGASLGIKSATEEKKEGEEDESDLLSDDECNTCPTGEVQWEETDEGEVIAMGQDNFDADTKSGFFLVEFYAPWCPHCKQLAPVLADASVAPEIKGTMKIIKIDATENKELAKKWGATSFPRLFWKREGKMYRYLGGKKKDDLTAFATQMSKQAVIAESEVKADTEPVYFRLTKGADDAALIKAFGEVALAMQDQLVFTQTEGAKTAVERVQKGSTSAYAGDPNGLEAWVRLNRFPTVVELSKGNFKEMSKFYRKLMVVAVYTDAEADAGFLEEVKLAAARKEEDSKRDNEDCEVAFGTLDGKAWIKYVNSFGLYNHHLPTFFVLEATKDRSYVQYGIENSKESILSFLYIIKGGHTSPKYSSYASLWKEEGAMGFLKQYGLTIGSALAVVYFVVTQMMNVCYAEYEDDEEPSVDSKKNQ